MEANIIDFICYIRLLTRISFSFLTAMLKIDIMKKVEINHFTILIFGVQFQSLLVLLFGLTMQGGWEDWDGLRLSYSAGNPLIPKDHFNPSHMCFKWRTSPSMNRLMITKINILSFLYCPSIWFDKNVGQRKTDKNFWLG